MRDDFKKQIQLAQKRYIEISKCDRCNKEGEGEGETYYECYRPHPQHDYIESYLILIREHHVFFCKECLFGYFPKEEDYDDKPLTTLPEEKVDFIASKLSKQYKFKVKNLSFDKAYDLTSLIGEYFEYTALISGRRMCELKLFGVEFTKYHSYSDKLVQSLLSNKEQTFLSGLKKAVNLADSGNKNGSDAIREALKVRSGMTQDSFGFFFGKKKPSFRLYKPGFVISHGIGVDSTKVRKKIVGLAKNQALLPDAYRSGELISSFFSVIDQVELSFLLQDIYNVGGASQGYIFQLLFNDLRCSARYLKEI